MKMRFELKSISTCIFILGWLSFLFSNEHQAPRQKILIYLKEPLRDNSVNIKLNNNLDDIIEFENKEEQPLVPISLYKIIYAGGKDSKRSISLVLPQMGHAKLEVYDFYGKNLGTLLDEHRAKGKTILEEDESWKTFTNFRGIAFFILTMDGNVVLKKLVPKVD
jgi:hypothetical protein